MELSGLAVYVIVSRAIGLPTTDDHLSLKM
jgi:hypothetical protein